MAIAQGEPQQADRDAHQALAVGVTVDAHLDDTGSPGMPGRPCAAKRSHREAARLFGAADALPPGTGGVGFDSRFMTPPTTISIARSTKTPLTDSEFDTSMGRRGRTVQLLEAIAYAQRGRGGRKRPSQRLGIVDPEGSAMWSDSSAQDSVIRTSQRGSSSPRAPWQTHLTHVYAKLGRQFPGCSSPRRRLATPDAYPVTWPGPSKSNPPKCEL